ncbi:hypothetical protein DM860_008573 [Cuscuta australis]|uniref:Uncharacterized protein n=1 Tax=Cuscuta australis TaxID=267555 RepID=A0A328D5B2_9ASTE|nr:hypothetical protein DM860_008573 [Cuscuta australis]
MNYCQGQYVKHVKLLLRKPVFCHGQLCVAVSRLINRNGLKILIYNEMIAYTNFTSNVDFKEVFRNL